MFMRSSSGSVCVTPSARPRGMTVTLWTRSTPGKSHASRACPASWYAVFSFFLVEQFLAAGPHQHLVAGVSKSSIVDFVLVVARRPESRFVHKVADVGSRQTDSAGGQPLSINVIASGTSRTWTLKIASRPLSVGRSTVM
jgi:hypothetical protein